MLTEAGLVALVQTSVRYIGLLIEALGVLTIFVGILLAGARYLGRVRVAGRHAYEEVRSYLGRAILLGLELLVAADIIRTVAVEPSFRSVGVLAIVVAIRTFLSFSLELEISGRWPWQKKGPGGETFRDGQGKAAA